MSSNCKHAVLIVAIFVANIATAQDGNVGHAYIQTVPPGSMNFELALNEGILRYELGDYEGALELFEPLQSSFRLAQQYCDLCYRSTGTDSSTRENQADVGYLLDGRCIPCFPHAGEQSAQRKWNFTVLSGYQYDSNVSVSPRFVGLGAVTNRSDSSWYLASFGDFRVVEQSQWNLGVITSTYDNFYFEQSNFDLQDYMLGSYTNFVLAPNLIGGVRYEFHETLLDYDSFASEHRLVPNMSYLFEGIGHATVFYEYDSNNFDAQPLIPALNPSAETQAVGTTLARYTCGGLGRLYAGYRYENANAIGTDFDRTGHQVNGRIEFPFNSRLIWDAGVRYFWDDYENPNSLDFDGDVRIDERLEVRTGIQHFLTRHWSTRVDYLFTDSDSNVANLFGVRFFDYTQHLLTAQMIYDF